MVWEKLDGLYNNILQFCGGTKAELNLIDETHANKIILKELRNSSKIALSKINTKCSLDSSDYSHESSDLFKNIATEMKYFLAKLFQDAEKQLKIKPPCEYAIVGLGSMANNQITPHSDLEFAIIVQQYSEEIHIYFKNLSQIVHFKVINLGETIIPTSTYDIDMSQFIKRAVNFDLGGKTPLGRIDNDKPYNLIGTKEWLLHYVQNKDNKSEHIDKNLHNILQKVCYVHGNKNLVTEYQLMIEEFLLNENSETKKPICLERAVKVLIEGATEIEYNGNSNFFGSQKIILGDLKKFNFATSHDAYGKIFDVKQEIYRLPDRFIDSLGMIYGALGQSAWDTVDVLLEKNILNNIAVINLKFAISFATMLRLKTYAHHDRQQENLLLRPDVNEPNEQITKQLHLMPEELTEDGNLFKFYYISLELRRKLDKFCSELKELTNDDIQNYFINEKFYNDDLKTKAEIHHRLINHDMCLENQLKLLNYMELYPEKYSDFDLIEIYSDLSTTYSNLSNYKKSQEYNIKALQIAEKHGNTRFLATFYSNLAINHIELSNFDKALTYLNLSKAILIESNIENCELITIENNICLAHINSGNIDDADKSLSYMSNLIQKLGISNHNVNFIYFNNMGLINSYQGNFKKSLECYKKSEEVLLKICGTNHPYYVTNCLNIANIYNELNDHENSILYSQKAANIAQSLLNHDNKLLAAALSELGEMNTKNNNFYQAQINLQESLDISLKIYGENNLFTSAVLRQLAFLNLQLSNFELAKHYIERSMQAVENSPFQHPRLKANVYMELADYFRSLDENETSLQYALEAYKIRSKIFKTDHKAILNTKLSLAEIYVNCLKYEDAKKYLFEAEEIINDSDGYKQQKIFLYGLKHTLHKINNEYLEALQCLNTAKSICLEFQNKNSSDYIAILNNIGIIHRHQKQYDLSLQIAKETVKLIEDNLAGNRLTTAKALYNLGIAYYELGDINEAENNYIKAISILNKIFDNEQQDIRAAIYSALGHIYHEQGNKQKSLKYYDDSLRILEKIYGKDLHPNQAMVLISKTSLYEEGTSAEIIEDLYTKAINILDKTFDQKPNNNFFTYLDNITDILYKSGKYQEELTFNLLKLKYYKEIFDENHDLIISLLSNIAGVHCRLGNIQQAFEISSKCYNLVKETHQDKDHFVSTILNNLSNSYFIFGKYDEALKLISESLEIDKALYDHDNLEVARKECHLGTILFKCNKFNEAQIYLENAHKKISNIFALNGDKTDLDIIETFANLLNSLGGIYINLGNLSKAEDCLLQCLGVQKQYFHENHPKIANTLNSLGVLNMHFNNPDKALEYLLDAHNIYANNYADSPNLDIAQNLCNLGSVYLHLKKIDTSLEYLTKSCKIYIDKLGANHPEVANCLNGIGKICQAKGDILQAINYYTQALEIYQNSAHDAENILRSYQKLYDAYVLVNDENNTLKFLRLINNIEPDNPTDCLLSGENEVNDLS